MTRCYSMKSGIANEGDIPMKIPLIAAPSNDEAGGQCPPYGGGLAFSLSPLLGEEGWGERMKARMARGTGVPPVVRATLRRVRFSARGCFCASTRSACAKAHPTENHADTPACSLSPV